jgi:large subunit ribosomal protein L4
MKDLNIVNIKNESVGKFVLDKDIFDGSVKKGCIYQLVNMYQANLRLGSASTKTRGEVSGGGIKPWKQKGTGRARHGSIRSPLWRHGGSTFGPHPRDYSYQVPEKLKKVGLVSSLNDKFNEDKIIIIDELKINSNKTKDFAGILAKLEIKDKCLVITEDNNKDVILTCRNIPFIKVKPANEINAYDVILSKRILATKKSLELITKRLKK